MTLEKRYLETLFLLTQGTEGQLTLKEARTRDAFMRPVREVTQTFEADRRVIYEKFCDRNEDGTPDTSNDKYKFKNAIVAELNDEISILASETVAIDTPEGIKEILEKSDYKPRIDETEHIDHILSLI